MEERTSRTIVITDITPKTDIQLLLDTFKTYGGLSCVKVNRRLRNDKEILIGFVTYENRDSASEVIEKFKNSMLLDGKEVELSYAVKGAKSGFNHGDANTERKPRRNSGANKEGQFARPGFSRKKVFIKGFPDEYSEEDICNLLGNCRLATRNKEKGYVIAEFKDENVKNAAVIKLNGKKIDDSHNLSIAPAYYGGGNRNYNQKRRLSPKNNEKTMN